MDTTKRKKTETKLEQVIRDWQTTLDSTPDYISIHDKNYKIVRVNRALADALKLQPEEVIGRHCYELLHKTDEPWPSCPHRKALETGKVTIEEIFEPSLAIHLEVIASPIFDENGRYRGDIS